MANREADAGFVRPTREALRQDLASLYAEELGIHSVCRLDEDALGVNDGLKGFGYRFPYALEFCVDDGIKRVVLETSRWRFRA